MEEGEALQSVRGTVSVLALGFGGGFRDVVILLMNK